MQQLGNGLSAAGHDEDALTVEEAQLSMERRLGAPLDTMLHVQMNLAISYSAVGRDEEGSNMLRDVYSGRLKLYGEEHEDTLRAAYNYATSLTVLQRFEEARSLLRRIIPVARRAIGENQGLTLDMRWAYAEALYKADGATLDDLREAVTTLEDVARISRRVLGGAHPIAKGIERRLRDAREALAARETPSPGRW